MSVSSEFETTLGWHEKVHRHLGEELCYFFVKVTPFDRAKLKANLEQMLKDKQLGSVRVFEIFGAYDLIARAWLHITLKPQFARWLSECLPGMVRVVNQFEVISPDVRWYPDVSSRDLDSLDERTIIQVQETGKNLSALISRNIITKRPPRDLIRFFVSVYFEGIGKALYAEDGDLIAMEIKEELKRLPTLQYWTIDRGIGFCSMLIKGESTDFFQIAKLPGWITTHFRYWHVITETFLVHSQSPLAGDETIGAATFNAMRGKSLFAYSILPELDDRTFPRNARDEILLFLASVHAQPAELTEKDKILLRNCLLAYLRESTTDYGKALYGLFAGMESFLRENYKAVLGRLEVIHQFEKDGFSEKEKRHLALGDVLSLISKASRAASRPDLNFPESSQFVELRNRLMHGALDKINLTDLSAVVRYLPGARRLIAQVETITGNIYSGD